MLSLSRSSSEQDSIYKSGRGAFCCYRSYRMRCKKLLRVRDSMQVIQAERSDSVLESTMVPVSASAPKLAAAILFSSPASVRNRLDDQEQQQRSAAALHFGNLRETCASGAEAKSRRGDNVHACQGGFTGTARFTAPRQRGEATLFNVPASTAVTDSSTSTPSSSSLRSDILAGCDVCPYLRNHLSPDSSVGDAHRRLPLDSGTLLSCYDLAPLAALLAHSQPALLHDDAGNSGPARLLLPCAATVRLGNSGSRKFRVRVMLRDNVLANCSERGGASERASDLSFSGRASCSLQSLGREKIMDKALSPTRLPPEL